MTPHHPTEGRIDVRQVALSHVPPRLHHRPADVDQTTPAEFIDQGISSMDLVAKLPAMEDTALAVLHSNAERLEQTGTSAQKTAAAALKPAIEAELAARREAKLAQAREAAATKRAAKPPAAKRVAKAKG